MKKIMIAVIIIAFSLMAVVGLIWCIQTMHSYSPAMW